MIQCGMCYGSVAIKGGGGGLRQDLHWKNRPPSRNKAQRTPRLCQAARYKLVSRTSLHGHRPHLQLAGRPYPWIRQLPKGKRSDRSPAFGRTQRESTHAIRSMLQVNASTALINMHHPPPLLSPSSTLSTSLTDLQSPPLHRH